MISLNAAPGVGSYFVDNDTRVSGGDGANKSISIANPMSGIWHAVVVNYDRQPKEHDVLASYATAVAFTTAACSVVESRNTVMIEVTRSGSATVASA